MLMIHAEGASQRGPCSGGSVWCRREGVCTEGAFHGTLVPQKGLAFRAPQYCGSRFSGLDVAGGYKCKRQ